MDFNVKNNIKQATRGLNKIQKKQVPYATALALTRTAQECQKYIQSKITSIFKVTKKWWLKQQPTGIKIKPATKTNLVSSVYTSAYFAELQEEGGTKRPTRSNKLLIPLPRVPKSRRKAGGATQMLNNQNVFSTGKGIYRRKGGKRRKNQTIEILFHKDQTAHVKPRFRFKIMAELVAKRVFDQEFYKALSKAISTAHW